MDAERGCVKTYAEKTSGSGSVTPEEFTGARAARKIAEGDSPSTGIDTSTLRIVACYRMGLDMAARLTDAAARQQEQADALLQAADTIDSLLARVTELERTLTARQKPTPVG